MRYQLADGSIVGPDATFTFTSLVYVPFDAQTAPKEGALEGHWEEQEIQACAGWLRTATEQDLKDAKVQLVEEEPVPLTWDRRYEQNVGGKIVKLPAKELKARLLEHAAARRYEKEIGGVQALDTQIRTDRESQGLILGALALVQSDPEAVISFKTPDGFRKLGAAVVTDIAKAVGAHVQECFRLEASVVEQVAAGKIKTYEAVDEAFGWDPLPVVRER